MFSWHSYSSFQYHGGTNFGRKAAAYMITGYYDQAPLDEYGMCINFHLSHLYIFIIYMYMLVSQYNNLILLETFKWH